MPRNDRDSRGRAGDRRDGRPGRRDDEERPYIPPHEREGYRPWLDRPDTEPEVPEDAVVKELPRPVQAELRGLTSELAEFVGGHLWAASMLLDDEPEAAYAHAKAARRKAGRLPIVREAVAETAYAAGDYEAALKEFRAWRRMSGAQGILPVMADCARALGREAEALELIAEAERADLHVEDQAETQLVKVGLREDAGNLAEAARLLREAIKGFADAPGHVQARVRLGYAEFLRRHDRPESEWAPWVHQAARLDADGRTYAAHWSQVLEGFAVSLGDDDEEDEPSSTEATPAVPEPGIAGPADGGEPPAEAPSDPAPESSVATQGNEPGQQGDE